MKDKVYLETYYHNTQDDIEVDETLTKYTGTESSENKLDFDYTTTKGVLVRQVISLDFD